MAKRWPRDLTWPRRFRSMSRTATSFSKSTNNGSTADVELHHGSSKKITSTGGVMQFGIFDQNDRGAYELGEQYENRLKLIEFYDSAGFRTYHMSERHSTPLRRPGMSRRTPSPSRRGPFQRQILQFRSRRLANRCKKIPHIRNGGFQWVLPVRLIGVGYCL